jgi:hypothetical protein
VLPAQVHEIACPHGTFATLLKESAYIHQILASDAIVITPSPGDTHFTLLLIDLDCFLWIVLLCGLYNLDTHLKGIAAVGPIL